MKFTLIITTLFITLLNSCAYREVRTANVTYRDLGVGYDIDDITEIPLGTSGSAVAKLGKLNTSKSFEKGANFATRKITLDAITAGAGTAASVAKEGIKAITK